jgi:hypothetical protein
MTAPAPPVWFAIGYAAPLRVLLTALGMGPRVSIVRVDADTIEVRMGWAFRARIPRTSVQVGGLRVRLTDLAVTLRHPDRFLTLFDDTERS